MLDPAPKQRTGAITDSGEIDRLVWHEVAFVDLARHSGLADYYVAAGKLEPAIEPLGEAEGGGGGHRTHVRTAVEVERCGGRAMEIHEPELLGRRRQPGAVLYRPFVDTLAGGVDAARQVDDGAEFERRKVLRRGRKPQMHGLERWRFRHRDFSFWRLMGVGASSITQLGSSEVENNQSKTAPEAVAVR